MNIGGEYRLNKIDLRQWQKFARKTRVDEGEVIDALNFMIKQLPDDVQAVRARAHGERLDNHVVDHLADRLIERAKECQRTLGARETGNNGN
jgi:serine/threonine-protein kinase HipA